MSCRVFETFRIERHNPYTSKKQYSWQQLLAFM